MGKVLNDDKDTWQIAYENINAQVAYVWTSDKNINVVHNDLLACSYKFINIIVWNKNNIQVSRGDYHYKHELCLYFVKKNKIHNWQGSRKESTVWDIKAVEQINATGHSTQKPLECMARPIRNNTKKSELVADPFCGVGTTMIASHQLGRTCYAMELAPQYCQIIINRMAELDPDLIIKKNGQPYKVGH